MKVLKKYINLDYHCIDWEVRLPIDDSVPENSSVMKYFYGLSIIEWADRIRVFSLGDPYAGPYERYEFVKGDPEFDFWKMVLSRY